MPGRDAPGVLVVRLGKHRSLFWGRDFQPLTVGLANLQSPHLAQDDLVSAGAMMAILPPLLLFVALNRYYVRGLFAGSER